MNVQFINSLSPTEATPAAHTHDHSNGGHSHTHDGPGEHGHTHEHLEHAGRHGPESRRMTISDVVQANTPSAIYPTIRLGTLRKEDSQWVSEGELQSLSEPGNF
jgi:hypothetical protein